MPKDRAYERSRRSEKKVGKGGFEKQYCSKWVKIRSTVISISVGKDMKIRNKRLYLNKKTKKTYMDIALICIISYTK